MGSKVEYVESSHIYATNYVRNSKAVGVLWGIFTICYAIIVVVAFVTPEWIGDTLESEYPGRFGLWARCYFRSSSGGSEDCQGSLDDLSTVSSPAFRAATVFVGLSVILALLVICSMLLFFFFQSTTVFHICGWIQVTSGRPDRLCVHCLVVQRDPVGVCCRRLAKIPSAVSVVYLQVRTVDVTNHHL